MLDVHPPEHGIHGVRDFFIHLLTITVGLLIALGLEAVAEAAHHRHQRLEAETTIRREIEENQTRLVKMRPEIATEQENLVAVLRYLEDRRDGKQAEASGLSLGFAERGLKSTGWQTASATGVLAYMDYDRVQSYAGAYQQQRLFEQAEERALADVEQLDGYRATAKDLGKISDRNAVDAIPDVRHVIADLGAMRDVGQATLQAYEEALKY